AAVSVWQPFALAAGIVEREHRGDRIDAEPINVEAVDPVEGVAVEEVRDLGAAEVVDRGVPVRMKALARIGVLVKRGAVEPREPMLIGREMRRDPVENDAQTRAMRPIDEAGERRWLAEAAGRREQADRLVAPGCVERMLADRQKLDMSVAHPDDIRDELIGKFVVGEETPAFAAPP